MLVLFHLYLLYTKHLCNLFGVCILNRILFTMFFFLDVFFACHKQDGKFFRASEKNANVVIWRRNTNLWSGFQRCKHVKQEVFSVLQGLKCFQYLSLGTEAHGGTFLRHLKYISTALQCHGHSPSASTDATLEIVPVVGPPRKITAARMRPLIRPLFSCKIRFYFSRERDSEYSLHRSVTRS